MAEKKKYRRWKPNVRVVKPKKERVTFIDKMWDHVLRGETMYVADGGGDGVYRVELRMAVSIRESAEAMGLDPDVALDKDKFHELVRQQRGITHRFTAPSSIEAAQRQLVRRYVAAAARSSKEQPPSRLAPDKHVADPVRKAEPVPAVEPAEPHFEPEQAAYDRLWEKFESREESSLEPILMAYAVESRGVKVGRDTFMRIARESTGIKEKGAARIKARDAVVNRTAAEILFSQGAPAIEPPAAVDDLSAIVDQVLAELGDRKTVTLDELDQVLPRGMDTEKIEKLIETLHTREVTIDDGEPKIAAPAKSVTIEPGDIEELSDVDLTLRLIEDELKRGSRVTYVIKGTEVEIAAIKGGQMRDADGGRWSLTALLNASPGDNVRVVINGPKPAKTEVASEPEAKTEERESPVARAKRPKVWTDDKVDLLRDMVLDGKRPAEIAEAMGMTKSAIETKIRRMRKAGELEEPVVERDEPEARQLAPYDPDVADEGLAAPAQEPDDEEDLASALAGAAASLKTKEQIEAEDHADPEEAEAGPPPPPAAGKEDDDDAEPPEHRRSQRMFWRNMAAGTKNAIKTGASDYFEGKLRGMGRRGGIINVLANEAADAIPFTTTRVDQRVLKGPLVKNMTEAGLDEKTIQLVKRAWNLRADNEELIEILTKRGVSKDVAKGIIRSSKVSFGKRVAARSLDSGGYGILGRIGHQAAVMLNPWLGNTRDRHRLAMALLRAKADQWIIDEVMAAHDDGASDDVIEQILNKHGFKGKKAKRIVNTATYADDDEYDEVSSTLDGSPELKVPGLEDDDTGGDAMRTRKAEAVEAATDDLAENLDDNNRVDREPKVGRAGSAGKTGKPGRDADPKDVDDLKSQIVSGLERVLHPLDIMSGLIKSFVRKEGDEQEAKPSPIVEALEREKEETTLWDRIKKFMVLGVGAVAAGAVVTMYGGDAAAAGKDIMNRLGAGDNEIDLTGLEDPEEKEQDRLDAEAGLTGGEGVVAADEVMAETLPSSAEDRVAAERQRDGVIADPKPIEHVIEGRELKFEADEIIFDGKVIYKDSDDGQPDADGIAPDGEAYSTELDQAARDEAQEPGMTPVPVQPGHPPAVPAGSPAGLDAAKEDAEPAAPAKPSKTIAEVMAGTKDADPAPLEDTGMGAFMDAQPERTDPPAAIRPEPEPQPQPEVAPEVPAGRRGEVGPNAGKPLSEAFGIQPPATTAPPPAVPGAPPPAVPGAPAPVVPGAPAPAAADADKAEPKEEASPVVRAFEENKETATTLGALGLPAVGTTLSEEQKQELRDSHQGFLASPKQWFERQTTRREKPDGKSSAQRATEAFGNFSEERRREERPNEKPSSILAPRDWGDMKPGRNLNFDQLKPKPAIEAVRPPVVDLPARGDAVRRQADPVTADQLDGATLEYNSMATMAQANALKIQGQALAAASTNQIHHELNPTPVARDNPPEEADHLIMDSHWATTDSEPPPQTSRKDHFHTDFPGLGNQVNGPYEGLGH